MKVSYLNPILIKGIEGCRERKNFTKLTKKINIFNK